MNSRVHPKYKTKYRVTSWAAYVRALTQCGNVSIWLSPRECADEITPMGETHLRRTVWTYAEYHNNDRPHRSLDDNAPTPRPVESAGEGVATPVVGGLHHRDSGAA